MAGSRSKRRDISGVLIFDKPLGMSSNAALQKVRWLFNASKGGHTGSLDPLASGVLPLCLGGPPNSPNFCWMQTKPMSPKRGWA